MLKVLDGHNYNVDTFAGVQRSHSPGIETFAGVQRSHSPVIETFANLHLSGTDKIMGLKDLQAWNQLLQT